MTILTTTTAQPNAKSDDGRMNAIDRPARHVPVEDRPEVRLFATELKRLFDSLNMSLGAFCSGSPIDKSALSRYLNGKRVPRDRYLLDQLFALRVEAGTALTEEARNHLIGLQLAALQVAHPHDYRVRHVADELKATLTALREGKRHIASLEHELTERTRQLADLAAANQQLRTAWDTDRLTAQQTIDDLTAQLTLARNSHARAEEHRRQLEDLLDALDTTRSDTHDSDASSAGARFQTAVEALQAHSPQQRTEAIGELAVITRQAPALREATVGVLLSHLRATKTAPEHRNTLSLVPAATHHIEPAHAAIRSLLQLTDRHLPRADLSLADLSRADLSRANLDEANLSGANLYGADLGGAGLRGANLPRVDLRGANLGGADLSEANLYGAKLNGADLSRVDLRGANLGGADLNGANLPRVDLRGADLSKADLIGADLGGADLSKAVLRGADLGGADLSKADLRGADLRGADLGGVNLGGADLRGADLGGVNLRGVNLRGAITHD